MTHPAEEKLTNILNLLSKSPSQSVSCDADTIREIWMRVGVLKVNNNYLQTSFQEVDELKNEALMRAETAERDRDAALAECERLREALTDCITVFDVTQDTQFHQAYADVIARAALTKKKETP